MRSLKTIAVAAAIFTLAASPAAAAEKDAAQPPATAVGAAAAAAAKQGDKADEAKICKRIDRSGTHLSKRYCFTAEQWKKIEAE